MNVFFVSLIIIIMNMNDDDWKPKRENKKSTIQSGKETLIYITINTRSYYTESYFVYTFDHNNEDDDKKEGDEEEDKKEGVRKRRRGEEEQEEENAK